MLEQLTDRAADHFGDLKGNEQFDPTVIMVLAELIMQAVEAFRTYCNPDDPAGAAMAAQSPTRMQKWWMRRQVRRKLGWREYRQHGRDVMEALMRTGRELSAEDMEEAYDDLM